MFIIKKGSSLATMLTIKPKRNFDVNNKKDLAAFKSFMVNNAWGKEGCPFTIEEPFISIPDMIKDKLVRKHLGIKS